MQVFSTYSSTDSSSGYGIGFGNAAADGSAYDVRAFVGAQLSAHERPAEHHAHPRTIHRADCDA